MFPHPSERFRLYIDETGIQSLKSASGDPYLCLFGVIMRRRTHDGPLTERLYHIKHDLFGHSADAPIILHRREMVRGEPPFDRLRQDESLSREWEYRWSALVQETKFICMAATIDKKAHLERYTVWQHDPYHYCLECLLERYVSWLNRNGFSGDVVIERRGKGPDKRLKQSYKRFYELGNSNNSTRVIQGRLTTGELKFAGKSDDIAALQLADSLAHPTLAYDVPPS
ncbi:DUF3800 domain-containing protein [uncultured Brevundimonas sp.]|uniref:DUF3800 domain-containing protein n=1 Tax=uncultured Brevundimonas sp. TaxID=213418 RepID=UPI002599B239|nr:DUF3800 domain-containing protein [uncultured Brevundimonas sp.]